jgi:hypothetical protein
MLHTTLYLFMLYLSTLSAAQTIIALNARINKIRLAWMWKEIVVAYFKVLSWYSPGRSVKDHKNPQSGWSLSLQRSEPGNPYMQIRNVIIWSNLMCCVFNLPNQLTNIRDILLPPYLKVWILLARNPKLEYPKTLLCLVIAM